MGLSTGRKHSSFIATFENLLLLYTIKIIATIENMIAFISGCNFKIYLAIVINAVFNYLYLFWTNFSHSLIDYAG